MRRGDEPHFLWVRFVVNDVIEVINHLKHIYLSLTLLKPSICTGLCAFNSINFNFGFGLPAYPMPMHFAHKEDMSQHAYLQHAPYVRLHDHTFLYGRLNRLAVPGRQKTVRVRYLKSQFFASHNESLGHIVFKLPARVGAKVDFVVPVVPVDDATMNAELALGYDAALAETQKFWKSELKTRTSVRMSEPLLQGWIDNFPRLEAMIAEKHPVTGEYGMPSGSYHYEAIWETPFAVSACALDLLGYAGLRP